MRWSSFLAHKRELRSAILKGGSYLNRRENPYAMKKRTGKKSLSRGSSKNKKEKPRKEGIWVIGGIKKTG